MAAEIKVNPLGPYVVSGELTLIGPDGQPVTPPSAIFALCRCGHSGNKPFCDGTHKRVDWDATCTALIASGGGA